MLDYRINKEVVGENFDYERGNNNVWAVLCRF